MRTYLEFAMKKFQNKMAYRFDFFMEIVNTVITIVVYLCIYKALYGNAQEIDGVTFRMVATNFVISLGHGTLGILLFVYSAGKVGIEWNLSTILYYIGAIIGGVLIQGGMFIFFSSLSFYFVETNSLREIFYWNMRKFAGYPISIYSKLIQGLMIYVVPFAFVNYFPAQYLLRKEDMANYNEAYMYIAPVVGVVIYSLAYLFWRMSVKRYKSTGN